MNWWMWGRRRGLRGKRLSLPILVVEDDPAVRSWMVDVLEDSFSADVWIAANAEEALDVAATRRFAVVITDMQHPGADGVSFCDRLRDASGAPVLVASAGCVFPVLTQALDAAGFQWLAKPFRSAELVSKVSSLCGSKRPSPVLAR